MAHTPEQMDCRLKIVGDLRGERLRLAEQVSRTPDRVSRGILGVAVGRKRYRAELLSKSDILVLPSVLEAGGAVVLEAMASGKAVIAVNWGGPADILDASCGILIGPRSERADLVAGLEQAVAVYFANDKDRFASMGRAGRGQKTSRSHVACED